MAFSKADNGRRVKRLGEPVVEGKAATVAAAVQEMEDSLLGQDPRCIEDIWQILYRNGFYRGGPILMSPIAGIDQALWDLKGQLHQLPVYQFLGARYGRKCVCIPGIAVW